MLGFFCGWKRKTGCVTLAVACVFAGLWVRSLSLDEHIEAGSLILMSSEGRLSQLKSVVIYEGSRASTVFQSVWSIRYWSITIPLTVASAWLLLFQSPAKKLPPT
jgi:hypothetical protein